MSPSRRIQTQFSLSDMLCRVMDVASIVLGMWVALKITGQPVREFHLLAAATATVAFYLFGEVAGLYRNWRGVSVEGEVLCAALAWSAALPSLLALSVLVGYAGTIERSFALSWWFGSLFMLILERSAIRIAQSFLHARGYNARGYAIVGITPLGLELADRIDRTPQLGLRLAGFFEDRDASRLPESATAEIRNLGTIDDLVAQARDGTIATIYITFPMRAEDRIRSILDRLSDSTASVYIVPDFFVFEMLHSRWTNISGLPAVSVFENPLYGLNGILKRAFDVAFASLILVALSLPMLLIAALVKLTSPGPVFFRQQRYGLDGREILVWKFRSMSVCESGNSFTQAPSKRSARNARGSHTAPDVARRVAATVQRHRRLNVTCRSPAPRQSSE